MARLALNRPAARMTDVSRFVRAAERIGLDASIDRASTGSVYVEISGSCRSYDDWFEPLTLRFGAHVERSDCSADYCVASGKAGTYAGMANGDTAAAIRWFCERFACDAAPAERDITPVNRQSPWGRHQSLADVCSDVRDFADECTECELARAEARQIIARLDSRAMRVAC